MFCSNQDVYEKGDLVFAQCIDEPYWPAVILEVRPRYVYKVSFIGDDSYAFVDKVDLMKFDQQNMTEMKKIKSAKLNAAIKKAQVMKREDRLNQSILKEDD
jgi:hypothetical protein